MNDLFMIINNSCRQYCELYEYFDVIGSLNNNTILQTTDIDVLCVFKHKISPLNSLSALIEFSKHLQYTNDVVIISDSLYLPFIYSFRCEATQIVHLIIHPSLTHYSSSRFGQLDSTPNLCSDNDTNISLNSSYILALDEATKLWCMARMNQHASIPTNYFALEKNRIIMKWLWPPERIDDDYYRDLIIALYDN